MFFIISKPFIFIGSLYVLVIDNQHHHKDPYDRKVFKINSFTVFVIILTSSNTVRKTLLLFDLFYRGHLSLIH